jgi:hypothetical protein
MNKSMFENGQRHGYGRYDFIEDKIDRNGKTMGYYEGEFYCGLYHGKGTIVYDSIGHTYIGEFYNGQMHGHGKEMYTTTKQILRQGKWIHGTFQTNVTDTVSDKNIDDAIGDTDTVTTATTQQSNPTIVIDIDEVTMMASKVSLVNETSYEVD